MVENPRFAVGLLMLSITEPEIKVFPVSAAILLLPVVGRCSNYLETLFWAKTYNLSFELIILIIR